MGGASGRNSCCAAGDDRQAELAGSPDSLHSARASSGPARASELLVPHDLNPEFQIYDLNIYDGDTMTKSVQHYYSICKDSTDLLVTTSCFEAWRNARKTNGSAKVIPAVLASGLDASAEAVRVFFFDDNINLHLGGAFDVDGICNLRDVSTGEYVDFSVGKNGFLCDRAFRYTMVHHSDEYRNVLVQANILDAMANGDYFSSIIRTYSREGEKLIVYADVNGTLVWDDTVSGKSEAEVLMMTMFRFAEVRPRAAFDFTWDTQPPVHVAKPVTLRQLVSDISHKDPVFYKCFWSDATCHRFLTELCEVAEIGWLQDVAPLPPERFRAVYGEYLQELRCHGTDDGIARSWLSCYESLKSAGHVVVLNSFGVDSQRVVSRCVLDQRKVLQITVNYNMWGPRDLSAWNAQFRSTSKVS